MTGLFHRLARQVVGPEPPRVRSVTRLPFANPPGLEQHNAEMPRAEGQHSVETPHRPVSQDTSKNHEGEPLQERDQIYEPPRLLAAESTAGPPDGPGTTAKTRADAAPFLVGPIQGTTPDDPAPTPLPAAALPPDASVAAPGHRNEVAAGALRPRAPEPTAAPETPPAPRPLLPEVPPTAETARQAAAAGPVRPPREADAGPPEVHVHIGRIDVASVTEPQPQRREPPRRREPAMSLEDYLAKRKSGG